MPQVTSRNFNKPLLVLIFGTVILCVSFGVRSSLGVYMKPISLDLGWGREVFANIASFNVVYGHLPNRGRNMFVERLSYAVFGRLYWST